MGNTYLRESLYPKERRDLERQQFNKLDSDDQKDYDETYSIMVNMKKNMAELERNKDRKGTMSFKDIRGLLDYYKNPSKRRKIRKRFPIVYQEITAETLVQYLECLCQYLNTTRRENSVRRLRSEWHEKEWPLSGLLELLLSQNDQTEEDHWPIYGQWAQKEEETEDGSPNCARQGDIYNCGVFTLTNAMCLGFGFDLLCYRSRDIKPLKRPRIFAELANARRDGDDIITGFVGKYAYDLLAIPPKPLHNSRNGIPLEDWQEPEEEPIVPGEEVEVPQRDSSGSNDLYESRGMADDEQASSQAGDAESCIITGEVGHRFSSDMVAAIETALVTDFMQHLPRRYASWKAKTRYVRSSRLTTRAFSPQFSAPNFRKAGFFYPRIIIPGAEPDPPFTTLSKYREIAFAHRKIQNDIAACVETFWNDEVKPMDGMIKGFDRWLAENPRVGVEKIRRLLEWWMTRGDESTPLTRDEIISRSTFVHYIKLKMGRNLANLK